MQNVTIEFLMKTSTWNAIRKKLWK